MKQNLVKFQGFIIITLFVVPACSAVFEKYNALFSNKTSKNTCRLVGCSILNALNLENWRGVGGGGGGRASTIGPFYWTFSPFFGYTACIPLLSKISPDSK